MGVDGLSVIPWRTGHYTTILVIILIACRAIYNTQRISCSILKLEEVSSIVTGVIGTSCNTTHSCEIEHETWWTGTHTSPHGSSNSSCALIEKQSEVVASCGAFHQVRNGIIPISTALDASTIIIDNIIVVSIEIRSWAIDDWRVHTGCCESITIVASTRIDRGVTIVASYLASCCTASYVIIIPANITDTWSIIDYLCSICTSRALGSTRTCTAPTITVAAENSEIGTLNTPIVVESWWVLNWIGIGVNVNSPGLICSSGNGIYLPCDCQQIVVDVGSTLHLSDGSIVIIVVDKRRIRIRSECEEYASSWIPVINK